jgi:hypothetical protein
MSDPDLDAPAVAALEAHAEQVASLIFIADRAVSIHQATGEGADLINSRGFGDLFSALQGALIDNAILAVAKLFEWPTKKYPRWNLPALLFEIRDNAERLPIADRPHALAFLRDIGPAASVPEGATDREVTSVLVEAMLAQLPNPLAVDLRPHDLALKALREQRNKVIAHNQAIESGALLSTNWNDLNGLLHIAKHQLGTIGWTYLRIAYMLDNNDYLLTGDAARAGMAMRRLLTKAELRPPRHFTGLV